MKIKLGVCLLILVAATSACGAVWRGWAGDYDKPPLDPRGSLEQTQDAQTEVAQESTEIAQESTEIAQMATSRAATETAMLTAQAATETTAQAATATMAYILEHYEMIYHEDFTDGRCCQFGDPIGAPANPTINMTDISVRFDPTTNSFVFELVFGQLEQFDTEFMGEVGFYDPDGDLLEDHQFYNHMLGNIITHFHYRPDSTMEITRWVFVNNEWERDDLSQATGSWNGNVINLFVPWPETSLENKTTSTGNIFWYATTQKMGYTECDAILLDVNNRPYISLPDVLNNQ